MSLVSSVKGFQFQPRKSESELLEEEKKRATLEATTNSEENEYSSYDEEELPEEITKLGRVDVDAEVWCKCGECKK